MPYPKKIEDLGREKYFEHYAEDYGDDIDLRHGYVFWFDLQPRHILSDLINKYCVILRIILYLQSNFIIHWERFSIIHNKS